MPLFSNLGVSSQIPSSTEPAESALQWEPAKLSGLYDSLFLTPKIVSIKEQGFSDQVAKWGIWFVGVRPTR